MIAIPHERYYIRNARRVLSPGMEGSYADQVVSSPLSSFGWQQNQLTIDRESIQFDIATAFGVVPGGSDPMEERFLTRFGYGIDNQVGLVFRVTHVSSPFRC